MGISRDDVVHDRIRQRLMDDPHSAKTIISDEEFQRSRTDVLKELEHCDELWIFGYGSLIWSPTFEFVDSAIAELAGYQRQFCMWATIARGSPEEPGLWLALDDGDSCTGVAFRIDNAVRDYETLMLWRREMVTGAYVPKVLPVMIDGVENRPSACWQTRHTHSTPVRFQDSALSRQ